MSRIGKMPVEVPKGVDVALEGRTFSAKGPKGTLSLEIHSEIEVKVEEALVVVRRPSDQPRHKALHGLVRSLVANMVTGVNEGFSKTLEIVGVGYRADPTERGLKILVGYSHPIDYPAPDGVTLVCPNQTTIVVSGADKQKVGQAAAEIRSFRPPEPYKGKGIRYQGEQVRRKAGKTAGA
ncbi:MAG: 50S ribosomal protein L6 [Gemmatimonadales bacterium]|nr:MAG: 50S ribosomal protein L6 [Gemmatimonadales bacterium]